MRGYGGFSSLYKDVEVSLSLAYANDMEVSLAYTKNLKVYLASNKDMKVSLAYIPRIWRFLYLIPMI